MRHFVGPSPLFISINNSILHSFFPRRIVRMLFSMCMCEYEFFLFFMLFFIIDSIPKIMCAHCTLWKRQWSWWMCRFYSGSTYRSLALFRFISRFVALVASLSTSKGSTFFVTVLRTLRRFIKFISCIAIFFFIRSVFGFVFWSYWYYVLFFFSCHRLLFTFRFFFY